jgi:hypothetical protein
MFQEKRCRKKTRKYDKNELTGRSKEEGGSEGSRIKGKSE